MKVIGQYFTVAKYDISGTISFIFISIIKIDYLHGTYNNFFKKRSPEKLRFCNYQLLPLQYNTEQNQPMRSGKLRHGTEVKEMRILRKPSTTVMIPI